MTQSYIQSVNRDRLSRIAAQIERLESTTSDWAKDTLPEEEIRVSQTQAIHAPRQSVPDVTGKVDRYLEKKEPFLWENRFDHANLISLREITKRLAVEMKERAMQPLSARTRQISALCAFIPFVLSVLSAAIRFMPNMPSLSFWSKITWFIAFPIFLSMTGSFVGFLIGIMLDSFESQVKSQSQHRSEDYDLSPARNTLAGGSQTAKAAVWVAVEDLEPNQRVAETVLGDDGTPILLRHTLMKPNHLDLLKKQNIKKIKVEVVKYSNEGEMALAG
jgi:K+-sensing histidine kinase KdpD